MNKLKIGALLIAVCITINSTPVFSIENSYASRDEIDKAQEELNKEKEKKEELNNQHNDIDAKITTLMNEISSVETEISNIEARISTAESNIKEKEENIKSKEEEISNMQEVTDNRIRSYYKVDMASQYLYILLKSDGIADLISNIYGISKLMSFDKQLITKAKDVQTEIAMEKKELEKNLELAKSDKVVVEEKKSELEVKNEEFLIAKEKIDNDLSKNEAALLQANKALQDARDKWYESQTNTGGNGNNGGSTGGESDGSTGNEGGGNHGGGSTGGGSTGGGQPSLSGFLRPGYGPVTDPYGPRINPVTGEAGMHNGVDFGDPYGANILASKSGTVMYSGWMSGYGNTIMIDHGGGVNTLYAHASSLLVDVGQAVSQGDVVALVGSTGMSTGPHIHFEILINGTRVDPMHYL